MTVAEYIKELQKYNPELPIKKSVPTRDNCILQEPSEPKIIMVDDWHYREETKSGIALRYTYEKKPIIVI